jgi:hypothetical protein
VQPPEDPRIRPVGPLQLLQGGDGLDKEALLQKEAGLGDALLKGLAVAVVLPRIPRSATRTRFRLVCAHVVPSARHSAAQWRAM